MFDMKDSRMFLKTVFLVYYIVVDTSDVMHSKEFFYPDIVFYNRDTAYEYVNDANARYSTRDYYCVELPIYSK